MTAPTLNTPLLLVCGGTGSGKSSLINALVQADVQKVGVTPTTREAQEHKISLAGGIPVFLLDTPGINEAGHNEWYRERLSALVPLCDLLIWVVGYDNRALDLDLSMLREIRQTAPQKALLILGNAVDRAQRNFEASSFDPVSGTSAAERAVAGWKNFLQATFKEITPADILLCSAGERFDDAGRQYNLTAVSGRIEELLPEAMRLRWMANEKAHQDKEAKAERLIAVATAAAGTVGLLPFPLADMPFIISVQVTLILALTRLYGRTFSLDLARSLSLCALSAVAGPLAFQALTKFVPVLGSVVGAGIASGCTYAVGTVTQKLLASKADLTPEIFRTKVQEAYANYKAKKREKESSRETSLHTD